MAGGADHDQDEEISGINITPLVDVVLVLLIIFLITAPALYQSAIKVQLPKAKSGEEAAKSAYSFTINKDGTLAWDSEKMSWEELAKRLTEKQPAPDQSAVISADENVAHGLVVRLMDTLRLVGITRFALNVEGTKK